MLTWVPNLARRALLAIVATALAVAAMPGVAGATDEPIEAPAEAPPAIVNTSVEAPASAIAWTPCPQPVGPPDEQGVTPTLPLECAVLPVPIVHDDPTGAVLPLALYRSMAAAGPDNTLGNLVINPGGPGGPALDFTLAMSQSPVYAQWNIVGMDPRGVGNSRPMQCEALLADDGEGFDYEGLDDFPSIVSGYGDLAEACIEEDGDLWPYLGTVSVAKDLDLVRSALGDEQLNFYGASYGTHLGSIYAELFPERVGRFVLDGPVLLEDGFEVFLAQVRGFEDALDRFDAGCAATESCALREAGARSTWRHLKWRFKQGPVPATVEGPDGPVQVEVDFGDFFGVAYAVLGAGRSLWDLYAQLLWLAEQGDAGPLWEISQLLSQSESFGAAQAAVVCSDSERRYSARQAQQAVYREILAGNESFALELGPNAALCSEIPTSETFGPVDIAEGETAPILIVAKTHDPQTPYAGALDFAAAVRSGTLLTVSDDGHTVALDGTPCVDAAIAGYLATGQTPPAGAVCEPEAVLGVGITPLDDGAVEVGGVLPGSAADGVIEVGDVLLSADGNTFEQGPPTLQAGVAIEVVLIRDGEELTVTVVPTGPAYWVSER